MPDLGHYQAVAPESLTVPRSPVTRKDYVDFVRPQAAQFLSGPDRGGYGPRHVLPALAVYALDGDPALGEGIKKTLRHYADWVSDSIRKEGGVFSLEGSYLCALEFRELRKRSQMTPEDERWAKDLFLKLRQYQFAWRPNDGLWRGQQHRSQAQGVNHALAAALYPDEPDAPEWKAYADKVWGDWWNFRDIGCNDINYFFGILERVCCAAELLNRTEVFTDPQVQEFIWNRLLFEVTPDGAVPPYGAHLGYNSHAGNRILALELAAKYTKDGRYRWVAHRLFNYGHARGFSPGQQHARAISEESVALASVVCDDSVAPVEPEGGSHLLKRKETVRLTDEQAKQMFPDAGGVDCNMYMSQEVMPAKLAFRSGWKPGDMFMLVECYPRHDPLNPTAILGFERYSSVFAMATYEKFVSRENAVRIEDLSGQATYLGKKAWKGRKEPPTGWDGMQVTVPEFSDHRDATHAQVHVTRYMGFDAAQDREFLFVKNRFVLVRDDTVFDDTFRTRVGPVWNTQNIGPTSGQNWLNTWFTAHWFQGCLLYTNPPWDLLVYHSPKPDRKLTVRNRTDEGYAGDVPYSTRYSWDGDVAPGTRVQFVTVLLPHAPTPHPEELADGIQVLLDEPGAAAVAISGSNECAVALLNGEGKPTKLAPRSGSGPTPLISSVATDARRLYILASAEGGTPAAGRKPDQILALDATFLVVDGREYFRRPVRGKWER